MEIIIVTGISGAGKSSALKIFEDLGFYCVDNLPVSLIEKFAELITAPGSNYEHAAIGVDIRSGLKNGQMAEVLDHLRERGCSYRMLFLDASNRVLVHRYKETRRAHPLAKQESVIEGIRAERAEMEFLRKKSDVIIDTSKMLSKDLRGELEKIFLDDSQFQNLVITVMSFGFKYGIPNDADLVFDVRFLPNPYYVEELRPLTGNDPVIQDYVMGNDTARTFKELLFSMIDFLLPNYVKEGKNQLVIAMGCTGGHHRSVTMANLLYEHLKPEDDLYGLRLEHRDIR